MCFTLYSNLFEYLRRLASLNVHAADHCVRPDSNGVYRIPLSHRTQGGMDATDRRVPTLNSDTRPVQRRLHRVGDYGFDARARCHQPRLQL